MRRAASDARPYEPRGIAMIGTLLSALIGAEIDEDEGGSPEVGALLGMAGWAVLKRVVPLAIIGAGILVAKHYLEKAGVDEPG
jgi:hypothetical protein